MAVKGTFTALQQLKPITTDFSDVIKEGQDFDKQQRELKLKEDKAKLEGGIKLAQEKRAADKDFNDRYGIDDSAILKTGFNSYDELMIPYASSVRNEMWDTKEALRRNPDDLKLQQKFANLNNSIKTIKASNTSFSGLLEKYKTLQDGDGISGVHEDKWLDLLQKYKEYKVMPVIDRKTGMTTMIYKDKNGNNISINMQDMIDGNIPIYSKQNAGKLAGEIADGLGVRTLDSVKGRFINTEISFDDVAEPAKLAVEANLQTDEQLADILNQANGSLKEKWDTNTPEGQRERDEAVKVASNWMIEQVKGSYDTKDILKERQQPRNISTAGERKNRQQAIDRNQTLANLKEGTSEQLKGSPAFSTNKDGKKIDTIIVEAKVTDTHLELVFSDGESQSIDINDKPALNEIFNKATGVKVDSDKIGKLSDVQSTKQGDIFEKGFVSLTEDQFDFITADNFSGAEAKVQNKIEDSLIPFGVKVEQTNVLDGFSLKLTDGKGNTLSINTGLKGVDANNQLINIRKFLDNINTQQEGFVKKNKVKVSEKATSL